MMEELATTIALTLSTFIEIIAALIIGIGLIQFLISYVKTFFGKTYHLDNAMLRVKFGGSLAIALELLLAADILVTAVAPTWEEIGKLGAIVAIRTALNFFLEKELATIEKRGVKIDKKNSG